MPFIPHTPESLLPRSDSKNPAVTCRGLTSTGRPCRRAIAGSSPRSLKLEKEPMRLQGPDTYCWQHKDQAALPLQAAPQGFQSATVRERMSVDTLVDRLGLLEVQRQDERRKTNEGPLPKGRIRSGGLTQSMGDHSNSRLKDSRSKPKHQSNLSLFCCIGVADNEIIAPRPVRFQDQHRRFAPTNKQPTVQSMQETHSSHDRSSIHSKPPIPSSKQNTSILNLQTTISTHLSISHDPSSRTAQFLSLVPRSATPQTTALLLAELAKPVSTYDEEGYIYIFWLTPSALPSTPPSEAAPLLEPATNSSRLQPRHRRTSSVLQNFSTSSSPNSCKTILLKIGRASNVQRRLNEWSRQCGYNLSLIRYYPYHAATSSSTQEHASQNVDTPSPIATTPQKVPHAHKIERLIHIELAEKRAQRGGKCVRCGSQHREWFEVEASREGVKGVDEVVRRWVDWGIRGAI